MRPTDQLEIIYQLTKPLALTIRQKSWCKYLAGGEVRHAGKSSTGTNLLEHVHNPCRAEYNERLRRLNACDRGMQTLNNFVQQFDMSIVNDAA